MILVTGGSGFIGQALIRHLVDSGQRVRMLIRPSRQSPRLPVGIPVEVAVAGLNDERGLRAAMVGVRTIYHLAGDCVMPKEGIFARVIKGGIVKAGDEIEVAGQGTVV